MEVSITKISDNGQIVIPAEVRKDAGIGAATKFLVFNQGGDIVLKQIRKEELAKSMEIFDRLRRSEEQIQKGRYVKANTKMNDEDIDRLLVG